MGCKKHLFLQPIYVYLNIIAVRRCLPKQKSSFSNRQNKVKLAVRGK